MEGQFSVALLRVSDIEPGKQRTFDEVKGEIKERIAAERVGQKLQELHDGAETDLRAKGKPLKEIGAQFKIPFREITEIDRLGKGADGKAAIEHADAGRIAEAMFEASPGVETEALELADGGYAWFDVVSTTPERQKTFDEVKSEVRANYIEAEKRKEIAAFARTQADRISAGEGMQKVAKELGAKVVRTEPFKRSATPPGLPTAAVQQAFGLAKGAATSVPTPDGKARVILQVTDIIAAPFPTLEQTAALSLNSPSRFAWTCWNSTWVVCARGTATTSTRSCSSKPWVRRPSNRKTPATTEGSRRAHSGRMRTHDEAGRRPSRFRCRAGAQHVCRRPIGRACAQVVWTRLIADLETPVSAMLKLSDGRPMSCLLEICRRRCGARTLFHHRHCARHRVARARR